MIHNPICDNILLAIREKSLDTLQDIVSNKDFNCERDLFQSGMIYQLFIPDSSVSSYDRDWFEDVLIFLDAHVDIRVGELPSVILERLFRTIIDFGFPVEMFASFRQVGGLTRERAIEAGLLRLSLLNPTVELVHELANGWGINREHFMPGSEEESLVLEEYRRAIAERDQRMLNALAELYNDL